MHLRNIFNNGIGGYDCEVEHPEFGWVPCTLREDDPVTRENYLRVAAGEFGEVPLRDLGPTLRINENIHTQEQLLDQINSYVSNPLNWAELTPEQQSEAASYRTALKNIVPTSTDIVWPPKPIFMV